MGWLFHSNSSKKDHSVRGNNVWVLYEREGILSILLVKISESAGNCPLKFIKAVEGQSAGETALNWRRNVKEYHGHSKKQAAMFKSLKSGDLVEYGGKCYRLNHKYGPHQGWNVQLVKKGNEQGLIASSQSFHMSASQIKKSNLIANREFS